jgi:quinol monooxygenase YgiN
MAMPARGVAEAMKVLSSVTARTRVQPGCISYRIYRDAQEKNVIMIEEIWQRQEDFERHLRSDEYRHVLLVVEMAAEKPEFRFSDVSRSSGLEAVEQVINADISKSKTPWGKN